MDFAQALILIAATYTAVEGFKRIAPRVTGGWLVLAAFAIGVLFTFLTAASDYGHTQIIGGISLADANVASRLLVGVFVGGTAGGLKDTFSAVRNIGQNE